MIIYKRLHRTHEEFKEMFNLADNDSVVEVIVGWDIILKEWVFDAEIETGEATNAKTD